MAPYTAIFGIAMVINVALTFRSSNYWNKYKYLFGYQEVASTDSSSGDDAQFDSASKEGTYKSLLVRYLIVYLLAALSDWMQGPYVYELYSSYGFSKHDIAVLFVAGFGSSMLFGSFIGGLADSCGRKKFTLLFSLIYALSCVTKHFNDYNILMVGRILGGIATSLLFSVFDSWLIKAHAKAELTSHLSKSFSWMQYGNSCVAIFSGLLANKVTSMNKLHRTNTEDETSLFYVGGLLNPFDIALVALIVLGVAAYFLWEENYGEQNKEPVEGETESENTTCLNVLQKAYTTTMRKTEIFYCGLVCSLFEGSMYIFVFMWTPAIKNLTASGTVIPFGLIFSTFMVFCMAGSSLFATLVQKESVGQIGVKVFSVATISFLLMAISTSDTFTFCAFNLFEMCVGMYFPIMGTMKSSIVPENQRAAIYNLFRIPLNFIVLFSLLTDLTPAQSFVLCFIMLAVATYLMYSINKLQAVKSAPKEEVKDLESQSLITTETKEASLSPDSTGVSSAVDADDKLD